MNYKIKYNLSHIDNLDALKQEQSMVRQRLAYRENELKLKMYEIPAEVTAAGVNSFIPAILRGKVTERILNGGKKLINALLVPEDKRPSNMLTKAAKTGGLFMILKKGFRLLLKK